MLDQPYTELPPLWDHQAEAVPKLVDGSYALYWEQRLGKTRACGEALRILDAERRIDGVIVLCPVNAKDIWAAAFDLFLPDWLTYTAEGLKGKPIPLECKAVVLNPDILAPSSRRAGYYQGWLSSLLDYVNQRRIVLIEDESHLSFINNTAQRYKSARSLTRVCDRVWQLSGTPMEKSGLDVHNQLVHIGARYPYFWANRDQFGKRFCEMTPTPFRGPMITVRKRDGSTFQKQSGGYEYGLFKDPDGFWYDVSGVADRRLRKDCIDVPRTLRIEAYVDTIRQDGGAAQWSKYRKELIPHKVEHTVNYVRRLLEDGEGPVVVAGWHRDFTETVAKKLRAPLIAGGVTANARAHITSEFQKGHHDVLVLNIKAGGVAIELTRAHHEVIGEIDWHAGNLRQVEDRLTGIKQTKPVFIHYLLCRHSVEQDIWDRVLLKGRGMDNLDEAARRLRSIERDMAYAIELEDVE